MENLQKITCTVYAILLECPDARDSDRLLLYMLWKKEVMSAGDFIDRFKAGEYSNPETVCRIRRKLQETHKALRGNKWDMRHAAERTYCEQLTFFDVWNGK